MKTDVDSLDGDGIKLFTKYRKSISKNYDIRSIYFSKIYPPILETVEYYFHFIVF
jgi:hypothetical protein